MPESKSEQGQTLVIITFLMLIALGIGVSISNTFFKNLKTLSQTDDSSRASAVAEAAVERLLLVSQATLQNYIQFNNCGTACTLTINSTDGITARATVVLSYVGNSSANYEVKLQKNETTEVSLSSYPNTTDLSVCWNTPSSGPLPSVTALFFYGASGSYLANNYAYNTLGSSHSDNGFASPTAHFGYTNCFTVTGNTNPVALRLKSLYADADVFVVPATNVSIPIQGILLDSTGTVSTVSKHIQVIKNFASTPTVFDYILYQKSTTTALSN
ncbi:MAG TPA: hypothetical protein VLI92_02440 [Candidatus Saccharimonadales bacterium]|nr:hypothetical protein [Candidatus Saccharimonadales bacterium]